MESITIQFSFQLLFLNISYLTLPSQLQFFCRQNWDSHGGLAEEVTFIWDLKEGKKHRGGGKGISERGNNGKLELSLKIKIFYKNL